MKRFLISLLHFFYDEKLLPFNRDNAANYITLLGSWLSRLGLYLFFVFFILFAEAGSITSSASVVRIVALILLCLGAICDGIDGYVSRKFHIGSAFGELFDPHHDKVQYVTKILSLLINALVVVLSGSSKAFLVQTLLIAYFSFERDLASMFHRAWALREAPDAKVSAGSSGKWRTRICFPGILILFIIMDPLDSPLLGWIVTSAVLGATLYSNYDYVQRYRKLIRLARGFES
jgi:phosphatidylglycerophosphate synthase